MTFSVPSPSSLLKFPNKRQEAGEGRAGEKLFGNLLGLKRVPAVKVETLLRCLRHIGHEMLSLKVEWYPIYGPKSLFNFGEKDQLCAIALMNRK